MRKYYLFSIIAVFLFWFSCSQSVTDSGFDNSCGQEPCYEGPFEPPWVSGLTFIGPMAQQWTHDNRVLETNNFLVFSDSSSDEAKIRYGEQCEASLVIIMNFWEIKESSELGIVDFETKLNVYSVRSRGIRSEEAFENGFVTYGFDSGVYLNMSEERKINRHRVFTHEATHVTQFLLGGYYSRVNTWMTEGLAEYVSGGVLTPIVTSAALEEWINGEDHINPIDIYRFEEIPLPYNQTWQYYPMFHLAFRYLLDRHGLGRTSLDIRDLFSRLKSGTDFAQAFEASMGISLDYYRDNFFDLMREFLKKIPSMESGVRRIPSATEKFEIFKNIDFKS